LKTNGSILRTLESRLTQLDERIRDLQMAASSEDLAAVAMLASARLERSETIEALERARSLTDAPWDDQKIEVGDSIDLVETGGSRERYVLVWGTGSRASDRWISHRSPIGRAVIGRRRGDIVAIDTPSGRVTYRIADFQPTRDRATRTAPTSRAGARGRTHER
jgi:transcription elongation factor GreA